MSNENNERDYLTLGDLRNLDLPDETPIIIDGKGGTYIADKDFFNDNGIPYITEKELEAAGKKYLGNIIEEEDYEEYKENNPDIKLIRALIF